MRLKVALQSRTARRFYSIEQSASSEEYDEESEQGAVDAEKSAIGHYLVCERDLSI